MSSPIRRHRSWHSGLRVADRRARVTSIEPATFIRPCMNATLGSREPAWMAAASAHDIVTVRSAGPTVPAAAEVGRPSSRAQ